MKSTSRWVIGLILLLVASLACSLTSNASSTPPAAATLDQLYTAAALTVQAVGQQSVTATPLGTGTSPFPTFSWLTPSAAPPQAALCDAAAFVEDISISDGTSLDRGEGFTKTWRIQNVGTCPWTPSFALVFVGGNRMDAPSSIGLSSYVYAGQYVDLSVAMSAPNQNGHYQGYWKLRDATGVVFGIGPEAQDAFWVDINVAGPTYTVYDFAAHYCDAGWENNNTGLPCPGSQGDNHGYVIKLDHPIMENGTTEDEAGLLTVPRDVNNGLISGAYPAFKVRDGDRFQALVNCQYKSYSCNVVFRLDYQVGNGNIRTLGRWYEAYEGEYSTVDIDLSSLAGQNVKFILVVLANGSPHQDNALWFAPRITRLGTPPPPTRTPTSTPTASSTPTPSYTPTATSTASQTPTDTPTATP